MDSLFAALAGLAASNPLIFLAIVAIAGIYLFPVAKGWIKKNASVEDESEQIRKAGESIRAELTGMLDKEQTRVEALAKSLDDARVDVSRMHAENIELRADMSRLRTEMKSLFRTARAMRIAMKKAITDNDVLPLKIWLDLNPDDEEEGGGTKP